jgi:hypothetical protein
MRIISSIVVAGALPLAFSQATTTQTTRMLRGKKVLHTRVVHPHHTADGLQPQNTNQDDQLVDPQPHHFVKLREKNSQGNAREFNIDLDKLEDKISHDSEIFHHFNHKFHDAQPPDSPEPVETNPQKAQSNPERKETQHAPTAHTKSHHGRDREEKETQHAHTPHTKSHNGHRTDGHLGHHEEHEHHFESHDHVEKLHEDHHHHRHHEEHHKEHDRQRLKALYALPTGMDVHFNKTLFNVLHNAPYQVYSEALGHDLEEGESFPVFSLPSWHNATGIFSGFSKTATPLIFENAQFLLHWEDIVAASSGVSDELQEYIADNNFHANLIIGKSVGNNAKVNFLGLVVSYYQYGTKKDVLVPFAKLEDFFDDTSEKHLLDPNTKSLEMAALHDMLDQKRSNSTSFYHPALAHTEERKQQLEDLEIIHFQKVFQLLIRRSFLFSFGYVDCLLNDPYELRHCLDDTYYSLVKMETSVRGALDDQIVQQLADINDTFHSKVSEACVSVQGSGTGMMYGTGSCIDVNDLSAFVNSYSF